MRGVKDTAQSGNSLAGRESALPFSVSWIENPTKSGAWLGLFTKEAVERDLLDLGLGRDERCPLFRWSRAVILMNEKRPLWLCSEIRWL